MNRAITGINLEKYFFISKKNMMNESIIALAILQMFLASTIPSLKVFQAPVEIILLFSLIFSCINVKFYWWEILLVLVFVSVTAVSFLTTELYIFSVNAKQNGLAVLSLLYFSKTTFKSRLILPVVIISVSLIIINRYSSEILLPFVSLSFNKEFNLSRFGGLFLNAHFNAFFLAIALIYYGQRRRLYGFGVWILYITASKFIFVSYVVHILYINSIGKYPCKDIRIFVLIIMMSLLVGTYFFVNYAGDFINFLITNNGEEQRYNSAIVILSQLVDSAYYKLLLNPFPSIHPGFPDGAKIPFGRHSGTNEIGLFSFVAQSGFFLAFLYLFFLFKNARFYMVFIIFTLLHNNFILSPLCIFMLVAYSKEISLDRSPKYTRK